MISRAELVIAVIILRLVGLTQSIVSVCIAGSAVESEIVEENLIDSAARLGTKSKVRQTNLIMRPFIHMQIAGDNLVRLAIEQQSSARAGLRFQFISFQCERKENAKVSFS